MIESIIELMESIAKMQNRRVRAAIIFGLCALETAVFYGLVELVNNSKDWQWVMPIFFVYILSVGCTLVLAFPKDKRKYGFTGVSLLVLIGFLFISCFPIAPRGQICAAYSAVVSQLKNSHGK